MMRRTILAAALCALAACRSEKPHDPARADAYSVQLPVAPAVGAPLQRLALPAEALAALRSSDRSDVRLFDAAGSALPLAAVAAPGGKAELGAVTLEALPILGSGAALRADDAVLSIEDKGGTRVVRVTQAAKADEGAALLGVLLDARAVAEPVRSLRLDARWPAQQPVEFTVEASDDLRAWTPLADRTLYRKSADPAGAIGAEDIALRDTDLRGRYLRISWSSPSKLLGPVTIARATLATARRIGGDRPAIETGAPTIVTAHELRFGFDHAVAPAAVRIVPGGGEMLIRAAISGRNAPDQPWTPLGAGVLRGAAPEAIALDGEAFSDYRIEADRRTAGFAAAPRLALLFEPLQLVALFAGKPPYTLAAGAGAAENRYLAIGDLIPDARPGAVTALPTATVGGKGPAPRLKLAHFDDDGVDQRKALLWALLLLGVTALALMVWRLWKPK